jgi:hypothetical protein
LDCPLGYINLLDTFITPDANTIASIKSGVPGVSGEELDEAAELAAGYLRKFCK